MGQKGDAGKHRPRHAGALLRQRELYGRTRSQLQAGSPYAMQMHFASMLTDGSGLSLVYDEFQLLLLITSRGAPKSADCAGRWWQQSSQSSQWLLLSSI